MTWQSSDEAEIHSLRIVTFISVGVTISALLVSLVTSFQLFHSTSNTQNELDYELRYCVSNTHDLWDKLAQLERSKGVKSRRKRQYFMDYCSELMQCGTPTNCGQEAGCSVHTVHSNGCGNTDNSGCTNQQPVIQPQTAQFRPQSICIYGPPGLPGYPGPDGMDGEDGEEGFPGTPGTNVPEPALPEIEDFCFNCPPAQRGPPGNPGPKGPRGAPGPIGTADYYVTAGPPGPPGPIGSPGEPGVQGPKGPPGSPGFLQGERTVPGPIGRPGPPGPIGVEGPRGRDGFAHHGSTGPPGNRGAKGANGRNGPRGADGPTGKPGAAGGCSQCPIPRVSPGYF